MPSIFLPRDQWATSPFLGRQVDVYDEEDVLGEWTGSGYGAASAFKRNGDGSFSMILPDGASAALAEAVATQALTATGTAFTGACEFRGIVVRAISGTTQTVTVYDATSATGTPIATFTIAALGTYYWDGDWVTVGVGNGGRRVCTTGCHVVISGGTSRTIDVMVE